ncbi:MAG: IS200/IS605 family element transposase accessory protein TnpB [Desulfobacterales bacterium]|nr:IS200/IS605 family element transposase accessory protein TnpB [Desulfobacterales bacterium]
MIMKLKRVERHQIRNDEAADRICFKSKNLYNRANYVVRQRFIETSKEKESGKREHSEWIRYNELDRICKKDNWPEYRDLPAQTAQQTLRLLEKNWKSFFKSVSEWKKNPDKFKARPNLPGYKNKEKGRSIAVFTNQQVKLKNGFIRFPKSSCLNPVKTKVRNGLQQVRIIPGHACHTVEVVYQKEVQLREDLNQSKYLSIDLGVNNLSAIVSNDPEIKPLLISGRPLKSVNQFFNKEKARLMSYIGDKGTSGRIEKLTRKRNNKINDFMHKTSKMIIDFALEHKIATIVIGKNDGWKQGIGIGKRNNQNFVQIPFNKLIEQLEYKSEEVGIAVKRQDESHTSKVDHFAGETIEHHDKYLGKRIKRGLFKSSTGKIINADINGSVGILKKAFPNAFADGIEAIGLAPVKVIPS